MRSVVSTMTLYPFLALLAHPAGTLLTLAIALAAARLF